MQRPLSPTTEGLYARVLSRAGLTVSALPQATQAMGELPAVRVDAVIDPALVESWTESNKALLRAALRRVGRDDLAEKVAAKWRSRRLVEIPTEKELQRYEEAANKLPPGRRALALLPLSLGLRASEVIGLHRRHVEKALDSNELVVMRKGGKEQALPCEHARSLLVELLEVPAMKRVDLFEPAQVGTKPWKVTSQILSTGKPITAYHALHRIIRGLGDSVGIEALHPHALRHGFATRMSDDGATVPDIQWMLGHASINTTLRYVHPSAKNAKRFLRPLTPRSP